MDYDGVLHRYSKGWQDGTLYDGPVVGARDAVARLREAGHEVVVFSSRCEDRMVDGQLQPSQIAEVRAWLEQCGIEVDDVVSGKPIAHVYVDDRAYRFEGDWVGAAGALLGSGRDWSKSWATE